MPKKRRTWLIVTVIVIAVVLLFSCLVSILAVYMLSTGKKVSVIGGKAVAVIRLEGVIAGGDEGGLFSESSANPEVFAGQLKQAVEDNSVKAIIIRVNSPGGSPAASQEMYEEVKKAAAKKPVIASVADIAASGSYYVISPVKEIMASKASDIGSIGVFIMVANLEELYSKLGIKFTIIKEGKYKTMGEPSKPLTAEERKILQEHAKEIYHQFIDDVASGRQKLTKDQVTKLATGRTWPGTQAMELGLIDQIGNYQDAIKRAAKLGNIKGEPKIITYDKDDWFALFETGLKALKNIGKLPSLEKIYK